MEAAATSRAPLPLRLITHNVRYATTSPAPGEELWPVRCPKFCAQLSFLTAGHDSAFICLQEVLHSQLEDISQGLGPSWARLGRARDDGETEGEYSPVFYRRDAWACERSQTYWLSETPDVPSFGWDAACRRVVTIGRFRHRARGVHVVVMSTHLDHVGVVARRESAKLLLRFAAEWSAPPVHGGGGGAGGHFRPAVLPVFLGGDFNSTPDGDDAYKIITTPIPPSPSPHPPGPELEHMIDLMNLVPAEKRYGNGVLTYTSFDEPDGVPSRIDFLFMRYRPPHRESTSSLSAATAEWGVTTSAYGILPNKFDDGVFLSDHRAVVADLEMSFSWT